MRMGAESTAESLSSESEKKDKTAHPTTDNVNVTDVEEEDASFLAMTGDWQPKRIRTISASSFYSTFVATFW